MFRVQEALKFYTRSTTNHTKWKTKIVGYEFKFREKNNFKLEEEPDYEGIIKGINDRSRGKWNLWIWQFKTTLERWID